MCRTCSPQQVYRIIAGYEDLNDAQRLRGDPALKLAVGLDPLDPDADLGSPATLCRFERWITPQALALAQMTLFEEWRDRRPTPECLILDADSTWDETHGAQQLSFFNAHYDSYGYHPLLVFDGETGDLIVAHLRPGNVGAAEPIVACLAGLVEGIRATWPDVPILLRADAGFATPSVAALLIEQARRLVLHMPLAYPYQELWARTWKALAPPAAAGA